MAEQKRLDKIRTKVRRVQLVLGLGFFCAVVGAVISASLVIKLQGHLPQLRSPTVAVVLNAVVSRVWVYAVLPASCYALCRVVPLEPWGTPIGAALTGEMFYVALDIATAGFGGIFSSAAAILARVGTLALGVVLANRAVKLALAANARVQAKADAVAKARATEYESFLRDAEQVANRAEALRPTGTGEAGSATEAPSATTGTGEPEAPASDSVPANGNQRSE